MNSGADAGRSVLAITDEGPVQVISAVALAVARLLDAEVETLEAPPAGEPWAAAVLDALDAAPVVLAVLAVGSRPDDPAWSVASKVGKPVVLVPPRVQAPPDPVISRVLVPLDGTLESAVAVETVMATFARAGSELVVLHVFDEATAPRFWDQPAHARRGWEQEFRARFHPPEQARIELRCGRPGEHVVKAAAEQPVDLIALGWSQSLSPGRAHTVRETVATAMTPVMLVPIPATKPFSRVT